MGMPADRDETHHKGSQITAAFLNRLQESAVNIRSFQQMGERSIAIWPGAGGITQIIAGAGGNEWTIKTTGDRYVESVAAADVLTVPLALPPNAVISKVEVGVYGGTGMTVSIESNDYDIDPAATDIPAPTARTLVGGGTTKSPAAEDTYEVLELKPLDDDSKPLSITELRGAHVRVDAGDAADRVYAVKVTYSMGASIS